MTHTDRTPGITSTRLRICYLLLASGVRSRLALGPSERDPGSSPPVWLPAASKVRPGSPEAAGAAGERRAR